MLRSQGEASFSWQKTRVRDGHKAIAIQEGRSQRHRTGGRVTLGLGMSGLAKNEIEEISSGIAQE